MAMESIWKFAKARLDTQNKYHHSLAHTHTHTHTLNVNYETLAELPIAQKYVSL